MPIYLVVVGVGLVVGCISFAIAMFFVVFSRIVASCVFQVSIFVCASVSLVLQSARLFVASSGLTSPFVTFVDHSVKAVVFSVHVVLNVFQSAVIASIVEASCSAILFISLAFVFIVSSLLVAIDSTIVLVFVVNSCAC